MKFPRGRKFNKKDSLTEADVVGVVSIQKNKLITSNIIKPCDGRAVFVVYANATITRKLTTEEHRNWLYDNKLRAEKNLYTFKIPKFIKCMLRVVVLTDGDKQWYPAKFEFEAEDDYLHQDSNKQWRLRCEEMKTRKAIQEFNTHAGFLKITNKTLLTLGRRDRTMIRHNIRRFIQH